jgi:hypothetical protein
MKNKYFLIILIALLCAPAQATDQYPESTHNYDSVWRTNIDDLRKDFMFIDDDLYSMYLKDTGQAYSSIGKHPINFESIKKPVLGRFVKASDYFDMDVVNKFAPKDDANTIFYILKDRLEKIKIRNSLGCEYKLKLKNDYDGDQYYSSLKGLKNPYIKFMIGKGYAVNSFVDEDNLLGIIKSKNGYNSGTIRVLIKGRVIVLSLFDCYKNQGKDQIIKDLTEWGKLLIKAN